MIEDLFKKIAFYVIQTILLFNILFSYEENNIERSNTPYNFHPLCSKICINLNSNFYNNEEHSFINLYWLVSHNLSTSWKTSLINDSNDDIKSHNILGFDFHISKEQKKSFILSFDIHKMRQTNLGNHTWYQSSLIFLQKYSTSNFQIVIDQVYDVDWRDLRINMIYGKNIFRNIFLYLGVSKRLTENDKYIYPFYALNFNI